MTLNAGDRKSIREAEKAAAQLARTRREVITTIMDHTSGRAYIWDQLSSAHIFSTSFSPDPLQMAFTEGERNIGLRLLDEVLQACPDQFILMMREHNAREYASRDQHFGSETADGGVEESGSSYLTDDPSASDYND